MNLRATFATASLVFASTLTAAMYSTDVLANTVADWQVPANRAARQNPVPATNLSLYHGGRIYQDSCKGCHGPGIANSDGTSQLSVAITDRTDGEVFWKVRRGHANVPNFTGRLSARQTWHVINYVRSE